MPLSFTPAAIRFRRKTTQLHRLPWSAPHPAAIPRRRHPSPWLTIRPCQPSGAVPRFGDLRQSGAPRHGCPMRNRPYGEVPRFGAARRSGEAQPFGAVPPFGAPTRAAPLTLPYGGALPPPSMANPRFGEALRFGAVPRFGAALPSGAAFWTAIPTNRLTGYRSPFAFSHAIREAGSSEIIASTPAPIT